MLREYRFRDNVRGWFALAIVIRTHREIRETLPRSLSTTLNLIFTWEFINRRIRETGKKFLIEFNIRNWYSLWNKCTDLNALLILWFILLDWKFFARRRWFRKWSRASTEGDWEEREGQKKISSRCVKWIFITFLDTPIGIVTRRRVYFVNHEATQARIPDGRQLIKKRHL